MTKTLTEIAPRILPETLILQYFHLENKHKRGNYLEAGKILLRYIYNSSEGKIDYSGIDGLTENQAKKFTALLRDNGYITKTVRNRIPVASINHVKFSLLDHEFEKTSWRWAFMICTKELSWEICKKAGKLGLFSYQDVQLKILDMIRKGYDHTFKNIKRFKAYMIKFLRFELNSPSFLTWIHKQIKKNQLDIEEIAKKPLLALKSLWITLKTSVSYITKNQDKLCLKKLLSRSKNGKEKEKQAKEKEITLTSVGKENSGHRDINDLNYSQGLLDKGVTTFCKDNCKISDPLLTDISRPLPDSQSSYCRNIDYEIIRTSHSMRQISAKKPTIPVFDYLTDEKCCELSKRAGRNFSPMAVRGLLKLMNRKRLQNGNRVFIFYSKSAIDDRLVLWLRQELRKESWRLEFHNEEEYIARKNQRALERRREIELGQYDKKWTQVTLNRFRERFKSKKVAFGTHVPNYKTLQRNDLINSFMDHLGSSPTLQDSGNMKSIGDLVSSLSILKTFPS